MKYPIGTRFIDNGLNGDIPFRITYEITGYYLSGDYYTVLMTSSEEAIPDNNNMITEQVIKNVLVDLFKCSVVKPIETFTINEGLFDL